MEKLKEYDIRFVSLRSGNHQFSYKVGKEFFDAFEYSEIKEGSIEVNLEFEKTTNMMVLNFSLDGYIDSECDLCLDPLKVPLEGSFRQIVKIDDAETESADEEIAFIPSSDFELNVAPFIFEFIHLCIPSKKMHNEGACNPDAEHVLNEYILTEDINEESESDEVDPRWEALRNLKDKSK